MSYIRCLSNPENLYIWEDVDGTVTFSHRVRPPLASKEPKGDGNPFCITMPAREFKAACRKWARDGSEDVKAGNFSAKLMQVLLDTGKPPPAKYHKIPPSESPPSEFLVRIGYKRKFVFLWLVTWEYVVRNVCDRDILKRKRPA